MGYTPPQDIDIGSEAIIRGYTLTAGYTYVDINNPANASGKITSVEIYAYQTMTDVEVGIFYVVSGDNLSTRSNVAIGTVTSGAKRTFSVDLDVEEGDCIGIYWSVGKTYRDLTGAGSWRCSGDNIPCLDITFKPVADRTTSFCGIGATGSGILTIGDPFSIADSKITKILKSLGEAFSIVDSFAHTIILHFYEAFSVVDSLVKNVTKQLSEAFSVVDSLIKNVIKQLGEAFSVVDSFAWSMVLRFYETLSVKDSAIAYLLNFYHKVVKEITAFTKVIKETGTWTKVTKAVGDWTKVSKSIDDYKKVDKEKGDWIGVNKKKGKAKRL